MKKVRLVAERYALALSRAVAGDADFARARDDIQALARLVDKSADLRRALGNPIIDPQAKLAVLQELGRRLGAQPPAMRMLAILAEHDHLPLLRAVATAVAQALDRRAGVSEVEIRSATPLDPDLRRRLTAALERVTKGKVRTREVTDPELLGGLVVRVGGTVMDGSVKTGLAKMGARLAGRTTGAIAG